MSDKLVSIISPCYNGDKYLERFFQSILNQGYPSIEMLFVNDGSDDKTEAIALKYKGLFHAKGYRFIYHYQENSGQASAVNWALKRFSGEYLTLVDSDDELNLTHIEAKVRFLDKDPNSTYCCGAAEVINEVTGTVADHIGKRQVSDKTNFFEDIINVHNVFFSGYLYKTDKLLSVLKKRDIYTGQGGQNVQLLLPMAWKYGEPGYVAEAIYKYYVRADSHSHSRGNGEKAVEQLLNYQALLIETIKRIDDEEAQKYIPVIEEKYARLCFGNAIDSSNKELIRNCFKELKRTQKVSCKDIGLMIKHGIL